MRIKSRRQRNKGYGQVITRSREVCTRTRRDAAKALGFTRLFLERVFEIENVYTN